MDLIYVDSSNVDQIGYDEHLAEAHVVFKNGRHYAYLNVSPEVWDQFQNAASKGRFVNEEFKAKGYLYREL